MAEFEDADEPAKVERLDDLITAATAVLDTTLNQTTATEPCDKLKPSFLALCNRLVSIIESGQCGDHATFFPHAIKWHERCVQYLRANQESVSLVIDSSNEILNEIVYANCSLLGYISSVLDILKFLLSVAPSKDSDIEISELQGNCQNDWVDDSQYLHLGGEDDESLMDDSDSESLSNKLCTYTLTKKEFVNQHWYHCHTCNMIDVVGVCSVCAKVCHKNHDISYAKYGAFFCDCAGREKSTCMALVKRRACHVPTINDDSRINSSQQSDDKGIQDIVEAKSSSTQIKISTNDGQIRSSTIEAKKSDPIQQRLMNQIEPVKDTLINAISNSNLCSTIAEFLSFNMQAYKEFAQKESIIGRSKSAGAALEELHSVKKSFYLTEGLMLPTLGSQEGAFENVRLNYTGERASLVKQLINNNTLRRVCMTSLSSPLGKRQHLVVSHEKGKITLLQLNTLLRQADSSKKKLTLTRMASAPIPFSVISIVANQFNEDVLAVCGLRDCHVLTFTSSGLVSNHIELHLDLSQAVDYVIKAIWIPGSQTELAVVTSEMVKIFDLSESPLHPKYNLKLAFGQLKDVTFIVTESKSTRHILIMNTNGHIFKQELDSSSPSSGPFYITTILQLPHPALKEQDGCFINGGGVSLYYSHCFKVLFLSYATGNFMASMPKPDEVKEVFRLDFQRKSYNEWNEVENFTFTPPPVNSSEHPDEVKSPTSKSSLAQPLCQWSEVPGHVGIIMAFCQNTNNPVILTLRPDCVFAQEIRYISIKFKITDATAIRHVTSSGEVRTTLILLCEDGSLRIYMASQEMTDYWLKLSPNAIINTVSHLLSTKSNRRKEISNRNPKRNTTQESALTFPIDFFENLVAMNDIEFGGADLLSIYSTEQLKTRLNATGIQVTSVKPSGFSIDILNTDPSTVICGVRVQVGFQDITKAPSSIEIFGRHMPIFPSSCRWYDLPLTREESVLAEKKLTISFGPSTDPNNVTRIYSIKVYGKTKESFSWPDDSEESNNPDALIGEDLFGMLLLQKSGGRFQKQMIYSMKILECCFKLNQHDTLSQYSQNCLANEISTSLLTISHPPQVMKSTKGLLLAIHGSRQSYIQHRDAAALEFVASSFKSLDRNDVSSELFTRLISIIKSSAQSRLSNLLKFSESLAKVSIEKNPKSEVLFITESARLEQLLLYLDDLFHQLYSQRPVNQSLASVATYSFVNLGDTLQPSIELVYMTTLLDLSTLSVATKILINYLLNQDLTIALCARNTLIRLLRMKTVHQEDSNQTMNFDHNRVRQQHLILLERLVEHLPDTRNAGGYRSISLLHAILVLTLDLNCDDEVDDAILKNLLRALREELLWKTVQVELIVQRTPTNEVKLVIMRMLSILMSKVRTSSVASTVSSSTRAETDSCWSVFCSSMTALSLMESSVLEFCYKVLVKLIDYWRLAGSLDPNQMNNSMFSHESPIPISRKIIPKGNVQNQLPDSSPFFIKPYPKGSSSNLFDEYPQLLTEMVLKIPYQIKKVSNSSTNTLEPVTFSNDWTTILCEYLMTAIPSHIKKNVRKLLTFICGSKEKYRQVRDFHFLESHLSQVKSICSHFDVNSDIETRSQVEETIKSLNYDSLSNLVEHLKSCIGISQSRCVNWQLYCLLKDQNLLCFLMEVSLELNEDVAFIILELLQHALSSPSIVTSRSLNDLSEMPQILTAGPSSADDHSLKTTSESLSANLVQQLVSNMPKNTMSRFIQSFLLETNISSLRWQAHTLLCSLWSNFNPEQQLEMLRVLWSLWHHLPKYGRKALQFVDLVGFMTLKSSHCNDEYDRMFCQETLDILRQQNHLLIHHPNSHIYSSIQSLVDLDCYYLESEPCSVCNNPEIPFNDVKLSTIKVDSRFTTTTQIIKLNGGHTILRFSVRISDIKRSKMVKTIGIYYNNRTVQSVVELKNKTGLWHLARRQFLAPNQTDVKIEFTLPIIACNLMIEFFEFYENFQATSETLQCPRCSASVSANPGVCTNCGENVFQCHKCRAINYDEKDPFLCISCGFCKYARFDITLTAKPTCAVDPIENEEDRKKTVSSISNLLDKADRVYKSLIQNKPSLELLILRIHEQILPDVNVEGITISEHGSPLSQNIGSQGASQPVSGCSLSPSASALNSSVSKVIQMLVQKYCVDCKALFEELSKIAHMVLASRKEIVEYDNKQLKKCLNSNSTLLTSANRRKSKVYSSLSSGSGKCYGCGTATVEHCVTMLKALSTIDRLRVQICSSGIIHELVNFNLRNCSIKLGKEVRELLCSLSRDDLSYTKILTQLLLDKIGSISKQDYQPYEISYIIRHEVALLAISLENEDQCWELRLKCLLRIFAFAFKIKSPQIMRNLLIPCLNLLLSIIRPPPPTTRRHKDRALENVASVRSDKYRSRVSLLDWLDNESFIFESWRKRTLRPSYLSQSSNKLKPISSSITKRSGKAQLRGNYLIEKYGNQWRQKSSKFNKHDEPIVLLPNDWLKQILFDQSSKTVRLMARSLVETLFSVHSRKKDIIDLLTSYLNEIGPAGECAQEFYSLYKNIILSDHWRYYLALQGILYKLGSLISQEIDNLQELEETTLNSSLSLGYSLRMMVELLTYVVSVPEIMSHYKTKLVGFVLKGYLSLRKLIVQRTKVIDETQEMLLELLEGMTTGSEAESANFITVCVEAIKNCHDGDIRTPVFIFERLCSTIHTEENTDQEFFVSLEKDPQQEDFLQGRMLGNPYSSSESGIGPLMKDIKNKICQDCELLALLEDDTSMELLVANKIISLDLPVKDVYKRIWCPENHENDAMRVIYRMRGLMGDATEEFIESLDTRGTEQVDEEQEFKLANVLSTSGGLIVMLDRLKQIDDLSSPLKPLLDVILRLFTFCTKTTSNRLRLIDAELGTISTLLSTLKLALNEDEFLKMSGLSRWFMLHDFNSTDDLASRQAPSTAQSARCDVIGHILSIMETLFKQAAKQPKEVYQEFCNKACGPIDDLKMLLNVSLILSSRLLQISHKIIQLLPFLALGNRERMSVLIDYFKPYISFDHFDEDHPLHSETSIDLFCIMVDAIEHNENGNSFKDYIVSEGLVTTSLEYLTSHAPPVRSSLLATSDEWKNFTSRPALKYVLRFLTGLGRGHSTSQILISRNCIPIVHGLEQVSSDSRVGTLAENLLEAIKEHPSVAERIEMVRRQTKEEKKRLAMAVRERQLGALGMKANERGQVIAKSKLLEQCLDLAEDSGLICNICREGYKFQPTKVLGIYTYTKRCLLDEFEMKSRKTYGYSTVTHFNTVHVECHMSAVRSARGREEWDSAALQNANTRCNGLLPIWGPQVPESSYANALARHNSYLQDCTGCRDISYRSTIHDMRLQLMRFAQERSFSEDTGGGGPQSNLHLLSYMMQTALYVLNSTKTAAREYKRILNYLEMSPNEILENCYEVDSPYYWTVLALLVLSPMCWKKKRVQFLQRLLVCNHVRRVSIKPPAPISDKRVRAYAYYKPAVIFFAIIDYLYDIVLSCAVKEERWDQDWSVTLAEYLKHNDQTVNDNIEILFGIYQNKLLTCTSIERFFEIVRMDEVSHTSSFLADTLSSI